MCQSENIDEIKETRYEFKRTERPDYDKAKGVRTSGRGNHFSGSFSQHGESGAEYIRFYRQQSSSGLRRSYADDGKNNHDAIKHSLSTDYNTAQSNNDFAQMRSLLNKEFDIIKEYKWTSKDFGAVAKELQTNMNSTYSQVEIRKSLNSLVKMVQSKGGVDEDVMSYAKSIAQNIMSKSKKQRDSSAQAILDDIKASRVKLSLE